MKKFYSKLYKDQLKVGIFTVVILAALVFGYLWLSNRMGSASLRPLRVTFSDVIGLEVGDKTMFRGMEVGRVKSVEARGREVLVTSMIDRDIIINEGAVFQVAANSLMGGTSLHITQGPGPGRLDLDKIHSGDTAVGLNGVMAKAAVAVDELSGILRELRSEQGLIAKSSTLLDNADRAVLSVDGLAGGARLELSEALRRIQELTSDVKTMVNANSAGLNRFMDSAPVTVDNVNRSLDSLQILVGGLNATVTALNSGKGTAGRLINDEQLYRRLDSTVAALDSLLLDVKANPKKYVRFSLF